MSDRYDSRDIEDPFDLFDCLISAWRAKWYILILTGVSLLFGFVYISLFPAAVYSSVTFKPLLDKESSELQKHVEYGFLKGVSEI